MEKMMYGARNQSLSSKPYPDASYAWFVVICLQIAYAVALVDRGILALLVQPIKADLHLTDTQFSLLAGMAFAIFYAAFGLILGRVADRWNRRNMIIIGLVLWSLATILCGLARNFHELFAARILVGVGEAALSPAAYSMISDYFPRERRARPISFYTMGICTGAGVALLFGSAAVAYASQAHTLILPLLGAVRSWQFVFVIVGIPGIVLAVIMLLVKEPERRELSAPDAQRSPLRPFFAMHGKLIAFIILAFALNGVVYYGIATWTPALFIRKFAWSAARIGYAMGVLQFVAGSLGILFSGWWVGRPSVRGSGAILLSVPRNALIAMLPVALIFGFANDAAVTLAALAVLIFLSGVVSAQSAVALYYVTPNEFRGRIVAAYLTTGTILGLGIGAFVFAAVTDYVFGNEAAIGKSCGLVFACVVLLGAECLRRALRIIRAVPESSATVPVTY
ncbi:MFS transporter [Burkholderia anthina]|uniref:MFS transporter n=1 Tax=Burkholderia anthina TaxID=179879 RepID=UPI00158F2B82|nr:MFS transporter [Burkholderia anthina]